MHGYNTIVASLLARDDVDVNIQDRHGRTALHLAASADSGESKVVSLLLKRADINMTTTDNDGRTPLCVAIDNGHRTIVAKLRSGITSKRTRRFSELLYLDPVITIHNPFHP